jgi:pyrroloquinoline quinone biosynthesis protein B
MSIWIGIVIMLLGQEGDRPVPLLIWTGEEASTMELLVLGTAQDGGVPHLGCDAPCCVEARRSGRSLHPTSLAVHDAQSGRLLLFEATPAVEAQVALLHELIGSPRRGRAPVDAVAITHAHIGHYLGLAQFGREVAAVEDLPVYVGPRMAGFLRENGPWSQLVEAGQIRLEVVEPGASFSPWDGLTVTAVPVPHRDEFSETYAYRIQGPRRTVLFVPDIDGWDEEPGILERLFADVDIAYVDATWYDGRELPGRDLSTIPHPRMTDTMDRLAAWATVHPGGLRFIHFNHTNPAWRDEEIRRRIRQRGFDLAEPGERVGL